MPVVVTGAAGFVGSTLVRALLARERPVRAMLLHEGERPALEGLDVEIVYGDVRNPDSLARAFAGAEVVYHLASFISIQPDEWPLVEAINAGGARNVVEACLACGVRRLVHFSSFHALDQEPHDIPLDECAPLITDARSAPYNRSKAAGQQAVQAAVARGLDAVIVNPTGIVGPGDRGPSLFGSVLLDLARGRLPYLLAGGCDWVDVRDVVEGALRAEEHGPAGAQYLLSGQYLTLRGVARLVEHLTGVPAPRTVWPMALARLYVPLNKAVSRLRGVPARLTEVALEELSGNPRVSHAHAARELGYAPRPIRQTIHDALAWYAEHGYLPDGAIRESSSGG